MENRNGLAVDTRLTKSTGKAERESAWMMAWGSARGQRRIMARRRQELRHPATGGVVAGDPVTPHVAQNEHVRRSSAIDEGTTRHDGYVVSQRKRKRIEEIVRLDRKPSPACATPSTADGNVSAGCSPSPRPHSTW
jgi:hypothetical protein